MKILLGNYTLGQQVLYLFVLIALVSVILTSCRKKDLDIQQDFPFEVKVMPIPKEVANGKTVELRFSIVSEGNFSGAKYFIRYFQFEGQGTLQYSNSQPYLPNDLYPLPMEQFRLYYTSRADISHSFDVWISDNSGNEKQMTFQFDSSD